MEIQKEIELFEEILLANPDFDEALLSKDENNDYEDSSIADQLGFFQAGIEVAEREARMSVKAQAVLKNDCMIGQTWFMKNTPVSALIKHAEDVYKTETVAQNSKIEFGTDDNEHWFAHDVPFYGRVQIDRIEERHGLIEWDIHFNDCWQGPFNSKSECIKHLEECIAEQREEAQEQSHEHS
ncbi:hypothetical protein [Acinetobacter sp. ANC 4654]|uniref:hypothetical protein n=1 Tax=Acinetobacter sp. ANC 4654 TaxID=1977872 RepID=UPI001D17A08D|nr:hypothetical protein [Acinetobacter sp. ANC 4654]